MPNREPESPALARYVAGYRAWIAAGRPRTEEEQRRITDFLERCTVEAGGPIPARFKDLQHLNERR